MRSYPTLQETIVAGSIVTSVATNGFAPDGQHGDVACFTQACWTIQGYGLSIWKPHNHPTLKVAIPADLQGQAASLANVLDVPHGDPTLKGAPDWSRIPWDKVLTVVALILQSLLAEKKEA